MFATCSVVEAVASCRSGGKMLVVSLVGDNGDGGNNTTLEGDEERGGGGGAHDDSDAVWAAAAPEVWEHLPDSEAIALRIVKSSSDGQHFCALFPVTEVPVVFFVNANGQPLVDPISGNDLRPETLVSAAKAAREELSKRNAAAAATAAMYMAALQQQQAQESQTRAGQPNAPPAHVDTEQPAGSSTAVASSSEARDAGPGATVDPPAAPAPHVEPAPRKPTRKSRANEEYRQRLLERERLRCELESDKRERAARMNLPLPSVSQNQIEVPQRAERSGTSLDRNSTSMTRLALHLPSGTVVVETFGSSTTLEVVRARAADAVRREQQSARRIRLIRRAAPRNELTATDDPQSLSELGLAPSARLDVVLAGAHSSVQSLATNTVSAPLGALATLFAWIRAALTRAIGIVAGASSSDRRPGEAKNTGGSVAGASSRVSSSSRVPSQRLQPTQPRQRFMTISDLSSAAPSQPPPGTAKSDEDRNKGNQYWNGNSIQFDGSSKRRDSDNEEDDYGSSGQH
mmetsp:Transcript_16991/g.36928  ORF Transcript_16991/g.36928 Transcript_16991/m.36928 type:complete len:516 (-) Transcript_16991:1060-2607(-)